MENLGRRRTEVETIEGVKSNIHFPCARSESSECSPSTLPFFSSPLGAPLQICPFSTYRHYRPHLVLRYCCSSSNLSLACPLPSEPSLQPPVAPLHNLDSVRFLTLSAARLWNSFSRPCAASALAVAAQLRFCPSSTSLRVRLSRRPSEHRRAARTYRREPKTPSGLDV